MHRFVAPALVMAALNTAAPTLTPQPSGTTNRLQAVSPVSAWVVWASGVGGTFTVTTDGGATWRAGVVPGAEGLEFRDVQGVSERVAFLMSAGNGGDSRIYRTDDGGATWTLQFQNRDPKAFYDCFAFWDAAHGVVFSDAVGGRFPALRTGDGATWHDIGDRLPAAQQGEGGFAASGTCVAVQGRKRAWIATGAAARARILATADGGERWQAFETPIVQGTAMSGGFGVAFRDASHGILVGGDLADSLAPTRNVASSADGGRTWTLAAPTPFPGAAFGVAYAPGGAAVSPDEGRTWTRLEGVEGCWAVAFGDRRTGWLVGTEGRIVRIEL